MKTLTISIAGYNVEKYIRQTLDSLCCKNISKLEVFVVDDGGNDHTLEIAKEYHTKYPDSIIPIHKENGGWGSTVNYSIEHATGKYFKLLDGDDLFCKENVDDFINVLDQADVDIVYTSYFRFDDETGEKIEKFDISHNYEKFKVLNIEQLGLGSGLDMHALAFKTTILQKNHVQVLENCFYTDNEFRMKGLAYSKSIMITDILLYNYRIGREGQSVDITGLRKHYNDAIRVAKAMMDFHKSLPVASISCIFQCVKNSANFVYWTLITLGNKDELRSFDNYIKNENRAFYKTDELIFVLLRLLNFNCLSLFSQYIILRKKISQMYKRLL